MKPIYTLLAAFFVSHSVLANDIEIKNINNYFALFYKKACEAKLVEGTLTENKAAAAQLEMTLGSKDTITLKAQLEKKHASVFQQIAVTEWDQKFIVAVNGEEATLEMKNADVLLKDIKNLQCEDRQLKMYHFNTHEWGSFLLTINNPSKNVELVIVPIS